MPDTVILSSSGAIGNVYPEDLMPEVDEAEFEYTAPSVIRKLPSPNNDGHDFDGVQFTGSFMTDDDRNDPSILFITAYRQGPDTDVNGYSRFYDGYGVAVMPLNKESKTQGRHNIFVVHNSTAVRTVVLEKVVHTGWGDAAYLASTSITLDPETRYVYMLRFLHNGGLEFYMAEYGSALPMVPTISYGAYQHGETTAPYYGIAASYTGGYRWWLDDFRASYSAPMYPVAYFEIDGSEFQDTVTVVAHAYAVGWDDPDPDAPGIKLWGLNLSTDPPAWTLLDSHTNKPGTGSFALYGDSLNVEEYVDPSDSMIRLALSGVYPSDFDNGVESYLNVDTIYAENWNQDYSHVGGMADIYLKESSELDEHSVDFYNVGTYENIEQANVVGTLVLPVIRITSMELIDAMGNPLGVFLVQGVDYDLEVRNPSVRFSAAENNRLIFNGGGGFNVRMTYRTFENVSSAHDYVTSTARMNGGDDLLVRACQPWMVSMTVDYRGSLSDDEVKALIVSYIMGTVDGTLSMDDLEDAIQAEENVSDLSVESWTITRMLNNGDTETYTDDEVNLTDEDHEQFVIEGSDITFTAESD